MGEVFGDAPSIAARAQAAAEPGSVLITGNVHRQVAGLFVAEEFGTHELKGVPAPVNLYRVVRTSRPFPKYESHQAALLSLQDQVWTTGF